MADQAPNDATRTSGGIPRVQLATLYAVLVLNAVGVSTLLSLLPSVGRGAHIPDALIVTAQAMSALAWVLVAGFWSRQTRRRGHRLVVLIGVAGSVAGTALSAVAILLGVEHLVPPLVALAALIVGRTFYGAIGLASAPAAQAFVAERTAPDRRGVALASLASAQGFGSVIGPAAAPFLLVVPMLGLAAPMAIVAALMVLLLVPVALVLPRGRSAGDAGVSAAGASVWRQRELRSLLVYSALIALVMSAGTQTLGFLIVDRVALSPLAGQPFVGRALMLGALATLVVQLVAIPLLKPSPRAMMTGGALLGIAGCLPLALLPSYPAIVAATVALNAGLALARPGVAAAASLVVGAGRQSEVAGALLSTLSVGIVAGPVLGVGLYSVARPLPFLVIAAMLAAALALAWRTRPAAGPSPLPSAQEEATLLAGGDSGVG